MRFFKQCGVALVVGVGVAAIACSRGTESRTINSEAAKARLVVDSVLPIGQALLRFQRGLPPVSRLQNAARSRDELVREFIAALESADSAALARLHVSRAEYAFLYYPTSLYTRKPYELSPDIAWLLSEQNSRKGRDRIVRRLGGNRLGLRGYECGAGVREGKNQFWRSCQVEYFDPTLERPVTKRLFGPIIEREGAYKLLSYSNDF